MEYIGKISEKFKLSENAIFQTEVTEVVWLEKEGLWKISTNKGDEIRAKYVVHSNGPLNRPKLPAIEGINDFKGHTFHTSRWDYAYTGGSSKGNLENLKDKKVASHVHAMIVPGSGLVKEQAEQEGLDKIFLESGFEWREPGCSMCLAMNADKLKPEERCASTSNRNFEGRQGRGGRTHLVSPAMAAAAAISGNLDDVRKYQI